MDDGNRYEPYQYGMPEDEKRAEETPKTEGVKEENQTTQRYDYEYTPPQQTQSGTPKKSNGMKIIAFLALAIAFGVIAALVFRGTDLLIDRLT